MHLASGQLVTLTITANAFLYKMVRNIMGMLVDIGRQKMDLSELKQIIRSKNRLAFTSPTAPAQGLVLYKVSY